MMSKLKKQKQKKTLVMFAISLLCFIMTHIKLFRLSLTQISIELNQFFDQELNSKNYFLNYQPIKNGCDKNTRG